MKPKIGILMRPIISNTEREIYGTYTEVSNIVIETGGIPLQLFAPNIDDYHNKQYTECFALTLEEQQELHQMIDLCDGIILQGGSEFYPYDVEAAQYTYNKNIPTLGICLGMQTMGYAHGGVMGHVTEKTIHKTKKLYAHEIIIDPCSKLYSFIHQEKISVNSRHQDCLVKTNLDVVARSLDGVIEAIEDKTKKFYIGVQWHPETMLHFDENMKKIFKDFIKCSKP